jgi:hypothetical protein
MYANKIKSRVTQMVVTKFVSYYRKLQLILEEIKTQQDYNNLSLAFADWYLQNTTGLNEQEIAEGLFDGNGDNGIDAAYIADKKLKLYQFKFPKENNIGGEIDQGSILKTLSGTDFLLDPDAKINSTNKAFSDFHELIKETEIYSVELNFVSYNKGIIDNIDKLDHFVNSKDDFDVSYNIIQRNTILNIFEKLQRTNSITVKIKCKNMQSSYQYQNINSWVGVINAQDLIDSVQPQMSVIFDENIRLFEPDSRVNKGILGTASSSEDSPMFYFYNNGITFIGEDVKYSPTTLNVTIDGASIVNGCQTVTTLYKASQLGKLDSKVDVLVRVIEIKDYDQRAQITEFLNSQTPIKDSYFIANHPIVRDLQHSLLGHGYFLERQVNEYSYKSQYGDEPLQSTLEILHLDDCIQYYTAYYMDRFAYQAKAGKGSLFAKENIEEILGNITAEKVILARDIYSSVSSVVTLYRRSRRNPSNKDFIKFMNLSSQNFDSDDYLFINTGDILIVNTIKHLKDIYIDNTEIDELIRQAIFIIKYVIQDNEEYNKMAPANITRNSQVFSTVKTHIEHFKKSGNLSNGVEG